MADVYTTYLRDEPLRVFLIKFNHLPLTVPSGYSSPKGMPSALVKGGEFRCCRVIYLMTLPGLFRAEYNSALQLLFALCVLRSASNS